MSLSPTTSTRKAIRSVFMSRLVAAGTAAGSRVYGNRADAWEHTIEGGELPALAVYTALETVTIWNEAPREYKRSLTVRVECLIDQRDGNDGADDLDDFTQQVEAALIDREADFAGSINLERLELASVDTDMSDAGERLIFLGTVVWTVVYITTTDEILGVLSPFVTSHLQHRFPGDVADRNTTDVDIPQG